MELQTISFQSNTASAYANQLQAIRPPGQNDQALRREQQDAETRVADRVTLSAEARQPPDPQNSTTQSEAPAKPSTPISQPEQAESTRRPEENDRQTQAENNPPPPQPQSLVRALEAYAQTTIDPSGG